MSRIGLVPLLAGLLLFGACTTGRVSDPAVGRWLDAEGKPLPDGLDRANDFALVLQVRHGPGHCGWQRATFLDLSWPLGTVVHTSVAMREYVKGPLALLKEFELASTYDPSASLPDDAFDTGYHNGGWHLWISPSQADRAVYVVNGERVERWPRTSRLILCS